MLDAVSNNAKSTLVAIKDKMVCITFSYNCTWNTSIGQSSGYVEWTEQKITGRLTDGTEETWRCEYCQCSCKWDNAQIKCSNDDHANLTYEMRLARNCNVTDGSKTNNIECRRTSGMLEENLHCKHSNNRYTTLHAKLPAHATGSGSFLLIYQGRP